MIQAKTNPIETLIIDGAYLCWRSYHATPKLISKDGVPTGAVHGFIGAVRTAIKETKAQNCFIAWEGGTGGREAIIPEYKIERTAVPSDLGIQMGIIKRLANNLGWPVIQVNGMEADDVIYSLVLQMPDTTKAIFTTDKDIISLVNENTSIYARDKGKSIYLTEEDYRLKWGVEPRQIPEVLALCGDAIDGIPGVKGVGKTTATKLVKEYGTVENILAAINAGQVTGKPAKSITDNIDSLQASQQAIQLINCNAPIPDSERNIPEAIKELQALGMVHTVASVEKEEKERTEEPSTQPTLF